MNFPPLLVLTDRTLCARPLPEVIAAAVECGARAVVLREKDLPWASRVSLAEELRAMLAAVGGVLIVAGPREDLVHLSAADALPSPRPSLVGRSCHSTGEVTRAVAQRCDYVTASPVFPTASKPGYGPALGLAGLAALAGLCRGGPLAYALGGVLPTSAPACLGAGAYGVAVMRPVMRDPRIVGDYLAALRGGGGEVPA